MLTRMQQNFVNAFLFFNNATYCGDLDELRRRAPIMVTSFMENR